MNKSFTFFNRLIVFCALLFTGPVYAQSGVDCINARVISSLPYTYTGSTTGAGDDYNTSANGFCGTTIPQTYGPDYFFKFTPATSGNIIINLSTITALSNAGFFLFQGCPMNAGSSLLNYTTQSGSTATLNGAVETGIDYYIMVDNYPGPTSVTYFTLNINSVDPFPVTGSSVVNPIDVNVSSTSTTTTTAIPLDANIGHEYRGFCDNTYSSTGYDAVYRLNITTPGIYDVSAKLSSSSGIGFVIAQKNSIPGNASGSGCNCFQTVTTFGNNASINGICFTDTGSYLMIVDRQTTSNTPNLTVTVSPVSEAGTPYLYQNTDSVWNQSTTQPIIGFRLNYTSCIGCPVTSFTFRAGSTTSVNDISNAKLWYTGTNPNFYAGATLFGTASTPTNLVNPFIVNGSQTLTTGYNYFWLTYDVPGTATVGHAIDANLQNVQVCGRNFAVSGAIGNPAGVRYITNIKATATHVDATCNGLNNGTADVTPNTGSAPFTYLWSNGATTQNVSTLNAGTYTVTVSDITGNTVTQSVTITEPTVLSVSSTFNNPTCYNFNDGSVDENVNGGTAPYIYSWSNGDTNQDLSSALGGSYTLTVTDANGCQTNDNVTLTDPQPINVAMARTNVLCNGSGNGSLASTITGGIPPLTLLWSNGDDKGTINSLVPGVYTLTVTDVNGCIGAGTDSVFQPTSLSDNTTVTDVNCSGQSSGSVDLTIAGGTSPYSYTWSDGTTTEDIANVSSGTYTVSVTDNNGCTYSNSFIISAPSAISTNVSASNAACAGASNGAISTTTAGGTGSYTYLWSNGSQTQNISGLSAGTYTVTVTDGNGCTDIQSATVNASAGFNTSILPVNTTCYGDANGKVMLTMIGGTQPFSYNWSNGATTQNLNGVTAGTYSVTITDANGCAANSNATVTQPPVLVATTTGTNTGCGFGSVGSVNLSVSGGTQPYNFQWSNGAGSEDVANLHPGTYTVTVTDIYGCTTTSSYTVSSAVSNISITSTTRNVFCNGASTGAVLLKVNGGLFPYRFSWSTNPVKTTATLTNIPAGVYKCVVTDANGCTKSTVVLITQSPAIATNITKQDVTRMGAHNGWAQANPSGGTSTNYKYLWSTTPQQSTAKIFNLFAGTYTVTVTDNAGCTQSAQVVITQPNHTGDQKIIADDQEEFNVVAFPNPSKGKFEISFNSSQKQEFEVGIFDMLGKEAFRLKEISNEGENKIKIDFTDNPKGIYWLKINKGGKTQTIKIVNT